MQIELEILKKYDSVNQRIGKGDFVFREGSLPHSFFQIVEGEIKMISQLADGKEFIQGIFKAGQSFGEPALVANKPYPVSAKAMSNAVVVKISKEKWMNLLEDYPAIRQKLLEDMANRLHKKAVSAQILSSHDPEEKILGFLNQVKEEENTKETLKIPYTRQEIADFTGLCVETVIRTLMKLKADKKVAIKAHKLYY